jgi:hypothetical protein
MERLRGLWALLVGGAGLGLLMLYLDPITDQHDCPNWGGNGNASAFHDENWDLYLPLLCVAWMVAVLVEQFLPPARRGPGDLSRGLRALAAALITVTASCCGVLPLSLMCH